jgi:hypothetical protein
VSAARRKSPLPLTNRSSVRLTGPLAAEPMCVTVRGDVLCSVTGLVDFECSSSDRHASSRGVARFMARVWYGGDHPQIIGERSMVVG